jgi:DNA-directed RNA polymerase sigma subunit (sigma70/sigma32)
VGAILNLTRERIRQVEVRGLHKIRLHNGDALGIK